MIEALTPLLLATAALAVLLLATPLTLLASLLIRWRYLRAVARAMSATAGRAASVARSPPPRTAPQGAQAPAPSPKDDAVPAVAAREMHRALARIVIAGLCFAAVLTAAAWTAVPLYRIGGRVLIVVWTYGWPVMLALLLVGPAGRAWRLAALVAYAAPWCLGTLWMLAAPAAPQDFLADPAAAVRGTITPPAVAMGWLVVNGPPTLLWGLVLNRWLRAIGPLVLAFSTLLSVALVAGGLALATPTGLAYAEAWQQALGWAPSTLLAALAVAALVLAGALGWMLLAVLRRGYLRRRLNERTILVDAVWLMFAAWYALLLASVGTAWALAAALAFAAAKAGGALALRLPWTRPQPPPSGRGLCFLRVFALGQRSERLFDALAKRWRHIGSLRLIAGPDLAVGTLQPHQLLDFVSGRLAEHFVADVDGLGVRLAVRNRGPDRDGLFRVDNLFCHADTWRPVLRHLVAGGDQVLMDLRSFDAGHAGCRFELEQLVHAVPLARWTLVVDERTDLPFLHETLDAAWRTMPGDGPNAAQPSSAVRVFRLDDGVAGVARLFDRLCDAEGGPGGADRPLSNEPARPAGCA